MRIPSLVFLSFLFGSMACTKSSNTPAQNTASPGEGDDGSAASGDLVDSEAEIKALTYDAAKHSIFAELSYGGCAQAQHQIVLGDICAESYPLQCGAKLKRSKSFDPKCKMAITETVELKLEKDFDTAVVNVESGGATMGVLVDREDKIKNLLP